MWAPAFWAVGSARKGVDDAGGTLRRGLCKNSSRPFGQPRMARLAATGRRGRAALRQMAHNPIEYGDMQIICEAYQLMKQGSAWPDASTKFSRPGTKPNWKATLLKLRRYPAFRTRTDFRWWTKYLTKRAKGDEEMVQRQLLDLGIPVTLIPRRSMRGVLSALKDERMLASKKTFRSRRPVYREKNALSKTFAGAPCSSSCPTRSFMLMREAQKEYGWKLNSATSPCFGAAAASFGAFSSINQGRLR